MNPSNPISPLLKEALQHQESGNWVEAQALYQRVLKTDPSDPDALHLLGRLTSLAGGHELGLQLIGMALKHRPMTPEFLESMAMVHSKMGNPEKAISCMEQLLIQQPSHAQWHNLLGMFLKKEGRLQEATAAYRKALTLNPELAEAANNLGNALRDLGEVGQAIAAFEKALSLAPGVAEIHNNLGGALKDQGKIPAAILCYRRALELKKDYVEAHSNLLLAMNYAEASSAKEILAEHQAWAAQHANHIPRAKLRPDIHKDPERPLRIGYVSPDFRRHAAAGFLEPIFSHHDTSNFQIYLYSNNSVKDAVTDRFRSLAYQWRQTETLTDAAAAQLIQNDSIDILVDLTGHTVRNRLLLFARKPAPIQITYLGYPTTTGLTTMDYRLTDSHADPAGLTESHYTEKLLRLPDCTWCYHASSESAEVTPLPALKSGYITFASFNNFAKVGPGVIALWSKILKAIPSSKLQVLIRGGSADNDHVSQLFEKEGVERDRILLISKRSTKDYFKLYGEVDVALDPFPCNGGTTTCDALWMGIPVLSLAGSTFVSRAGVTLLQNLQLNQWICATPEDYVNAAIRLTSDLSALAELRSQLRSRMQKSPLMDAPRFTKNLEKAYRTAWREWCFS